MIERTGESAGRRSFPARAGIAALNLIVPGLGLLRIGASRIGLSFLLAPFALGALITFGLGTLPPASYMGALFALIVVIALLAMLYIVPAVLTWRGSKLRVPAHGWSRWYGLLPIAVGVLGIWQVMPALMHRFYKPFYAPSESMAPTIGKGDKFVVNMRWRGPLERGEIVLFQAADSVRVSRIVALAGDRVALRRGVLIMNGLTVAQHPQGTAGTQLAAVMAERLPAERSTHLILDLGDSEFDDMPEALVPPDHFYVLGDNRDRSADSLMSPEQMGVGMVPVAAVLGRPMYIHWSSDRAKIGSRLDR